MACFRAGQGLIHVPVISLEGDVVRVFLWSLECNDVLYSVPLSLCISSVVISFGVGELQVI